MANIQKVGVVGAGTMGNGIAQVFAQHGHPVVLRDLDRAILERARTQIEKSLAKLAEASPFTLREIEDGRLLPTIGLLWRLAAVLEVDCAAFLERPAERE